jgi:hypothetical protein
VSVSTDHHSPAWRKSSYSGNQDHSECVEVAALTDGTIAVRNSKNPAAGTVHFTRAEMHAWITRVKDGKFDDLT